MECVEADQETFCRILGGVISESRSTERVPDLQRDLKCAAPKLNDPKQIQTERAGNQVISMFGCHKEGIRRGVGQGTTHTGDPELSTHSRAAHPDLQTVQTKCNKMYTSTPLRIHIS